ncbi:MAG: diguanylate cyclase [Phycisphaerales bacterium]|nr:diguanylate cyclase [Phycisphaerales bacterium]
MEILTPSPTAGGEPTEDRRPVALLIDDSPDVHRLLAMRLRSEGIDVVSATSGEQGLGIATTSIPAVVLLDIDMPGMDGFEVLRRLKETDATLNVPVIMLSGLHSPQDKVTAFDLGAVDFISKPFDVTELRVRVRSALRVSQLLRMLSQLAHIDGLSGLYNRLHFDRRWTEEVASTARHHRPLSLAIFDLDHFKSVNDTYGHPAGDAAIQGLAKLLCKECRQSDVPCRFGGEEFALIMPETSPADAGAVCDRIRSALAELAWPRHPERAITCSVGVVGSTGAVGVPPERWIELADSNLYRAKKEGRNRVVTSAIDGGISLARAS